MNTTELVLKRTKSVDNLRTFGELYIDFYKFCDTLEDIERLFYNDKGVLVGTKEKGKTAIPKGRYEVKMYWSTRFKRILPALLDVPQFTGILMHGVNTELDTEGCLGVGEKVSDKLIAGAKTKGILDKLCAIITERLKSGKVFITII